MKTIVRIPFYLFIAYGFLCCEKVVPEEPDTNPNDSIPTDTIPTDTIPSDTAGYSNLPNIIHIFADDLGYGDIGCFGATDIKTPNIDKMADKGIRFSEFYSASSICSPSRAALLTGRLPQRMGICSVFFPESQTGLALEEITIAELLKEKQYTTGIVGKWHLGHQIDYLPLQHGFDSYFGIPYSNDMKDVVYIRGNEIEEYSVDQRYITKTYTEEAVKFISDNKNKHFFLYLAHSMPHVPIYASEDFVGKSGRGLYGDVIQELDWSVGEILDKLEQLDLMKNTLIVFSSDNGPWLVMKENGGSAGILREGKNFTFEGGMRVPTVAMWEGKIPEGIEYNDVASQMDWFPTFANLTGISLPTDRALDGEDISKVLFNEGVREDDTFLYLDEITGEVQCYRNGKWKIKKPYPGFSGTPWKSKVAAHDTLLIDLKADPGETNSLHSQFPGQTIDLFEEMYQKYSALGELPPPLKTR